VLAGSNLHACWLQATRVALPCLTLPPKLVRSVLQVSDFNLSKILEPQQTTSSTGGGAANPLWLAPEVFEGGRATAASGGSILQCLRLCQEPDGRGCCAVGVGGPAACSQPSLAGCAPSAGFPSLASLAGRDPVPTPADPPLSFPFPSGPPDTYGFGMVLYELLTWQLPFVGTPPFRVRAPGGGVGVGGGGGGVPHISGPDVLPAGCQHRGSRACLLLQTQGLLCPHRVPWRCAWRPCRLRTWC
jgi:hypothetical protein